jgi:protein-disulfide isomerase
MKRIVDAGLANFRFYDYPLTELHGNTMIAHLAASCANDQGKFWEMHDLIFQGQYDWNTQATREPRRVLDTYAQKVGLDMNVYDQCLSTRKNLAQIEANKQAGVARAVSSTPTLVIGDKVYPGGLTYDRLKKVVDSTIAAMPGATAPAATTPADTGKR